MLRIILVRPGATDYDQQERIQGTLDIPLNEQGVSEAAQVVEQLKDKAIEVVYACPCQSAQGTALAISEGLGVKLKKVDRLQNLDLGLWQGQQVGEVRHKQPKVYRQWQEQPENVCPPEGEMLSDAEDRVRTALAKVLRRHKEGVIALVAPEPLASLVRHQIRHDELGDLWKSLQGHGQWEVLEVQPPVPVLSESE